MHTDDVESGVSGVSCCGSCPCALHLAAGSLISELSLLFFVWITPDRRRHTFFLHAHTHTVQTSPPNTHSITQLILSDTECDLQGTDNWCATTQRLHSSSGWKPCSLHTWRKTHFFLLAIIMSLVYYCTAKSLENCISLLYISLQVRKT